MVACRLDVDSNLLESRSIVCIPARNETDLPSNVLGAGPIQRHHDLGAETTVNLFERPVAQPHKLLAAIWVVCVTNSKSLASRLLTVRTTRHCTVSLRFPSLNFYTHYVQLSRESPTVISLLLQPRWPHLLACPKAHHRANASAPRPRRPSCCEAPPALVWCPP